jgi:hypothetical protein
MSTAINPEHTISQVMRLVESDKRSEIRLNANGGNSLLLLCPPKLEFEYITVLNKLLDTEKYTIIDLNEVLVLFVEENKNDIVELFDILKASINQIFTAAIGEVRDDLYSRIISAVKIAYSQDKIPVLVNAGVLYGAKLNFNKLLEDNIIEHGIHPVIILYPGHKDSETYYFLNDKIASDYRCLIID